MITKTCANLLRKQAGWKEVLTSVATTGGLGGLGGLLSYMAAKKLLGLDETKSSLVGAAGATLGAFGGNRLGKYFNALRNGTNLAEFVKAQPNHELSRLILDTSADTGLSPKQLGRDNYDMYHWY